MVREKRENGCIIVCIKYILSCLLLSLCIALSFHIRCGWGLAIVTAGAAVSLICFSPIDSENRRLCMEELKRCKKATAALVLIFMLMDALFLACGLRIYAVCVSIGIVLAAGLQIPCIFRNLGKPSGK